MNIGYSGHHGIHELVQNTSANAYGFGSLPATVCASPPVPPCADPRFSFVTEFQISAVSNDNGMVVSFRRRWSQGLFEANYTYGHALDEISNGGFPPSRTPRFSLRRIRTICGELMGRLTTMCCTPLTQATFGNSP